MSRIISIDLIRINKIQNRKTNSIVFFKTANGFKIELIFNKSINILKIAAILHGKKKKIPSFHLEISNFSLTYIKKN